MRRPLLFVSVFIACGIVLTACGRPTPAALQFEPGDNQVPETLAQLDSEGQAPETTTNASGNVLAEPQPRVRGTFNQPDIGVKVTSANTVIEGQLESNTATTTSNQNTPQTTTATTQQQQQNNRVAQTYVVQEGDTLSVIANNKFDLLVSDLTAANNIGDRDEIKPGQVLNIPAS